MRAVPFESIPALCGFCFQRFHDPEAYKAPDPPCMRIRHVPRAACCAAQWAERTGVRCARDHHRGIANLHRMLAQMPTVGHQSTRQPCILFLFVLFRGLARLCSAAGFLPLEFQPYLNPQQRNFEALNGAPIFSNLHQGLEAQAKLGVGRSLDRVSQSSWNLGLRM